MLKTSQVQVKVLSTSKKYLHLKSTFKGKRILHANVSDIAI